MKTILSTLIFGTSVMVASAIIDFNNDKTGDKSNGPGWKELQNPPPQDTNHGFDPNTPTYSAVPESAAIVGVSLLVLPFGVSVLRGLRGNKPSANKIS